VNETELHLAELEARIAALEAKTDRMNDAGLATTKGGIALVHEIDELRTQITALETRAIRRLELVEEAVFSPALEPETVTINKALALRLADALPDVRLDDHFEDEYGFTYQEWRDLVAEFMREAETF
jgi:hypothetical protein